MNDLAPIALFVYNRPNHTRKTISALKNNVLAKHSDLYIYSDAAKNDSSIDLVNEVRNALSLVDGFKTITIIKRESNFGLAKSIIDGATDIMRKYGNVIVLEDDLVTSKYFLNFMNDGLRVYKDRQDIISITGFSFSLNLMSTLKKYEDDVYLNVRPMSWSWATWHDKWKNVDWAVGDYSDFILSKEMIKKFNNGGTDLSAMLDRQMRGKLDSWYIRWSYHAFKKGAYTIYPKLSFVNNIGHDNTGVHCVSDANKIFSHKELNNNKKVRFPKDIVLRQDIVDDFNDKFNLGFKSRVKQYIKKFIGI